MVTAPDDQRKRKIVVVIDQPGETAGEPETRRETCDRASHEESHPRMRAQPVAVVLARVVRLVEPLGARCAVRR